MFHRQSTTFLVLTLLVVSVSRAAAQMPVNRVVLAEAKIVDAPATITVVGTVEPYRFSRVGAEIDGLVIEMPGREGDLIEAGGVIAKLNDDTLLLRLAEEKARLGSVKAVHEELLAGTRQEELARLAALLEEAVAEYERWSFEMQRIERLYEGRDSNDKEFRDTRASFQAAAARRRAAQAAHAQGVAGPRKETIARAAYAVAQQQAVVDRVASDLKKTLVRAPFSGFVVDRLTEVGEWIGSGDPVVEMVDLHAVLVRVDVPESAYPFIRVGDEVRVRIDALGKSFAGRVRHIMPRADRNARTFPVKIEVDNADHLLAAGMFARAAVPSGPKMQVVAVPKDAVVERGGRVYVATVVPGREGEPAGVLTPVTLGGDIGDRVAITSGNINAGARVITRGTERVLPFPSPILIVDEFGTPVAAQENERAGDKNPAG